MSESTVTTFENVSFAYSDQQILENVNFSIGANEFACVVGPNGGGKTTLLKLMLGLIKPDAGRINVFGMAPEKARSRIGYMPQKAMLDPQFPATAMDIVLMGRLGSATKFGPYKKKERDIASSSLREVGLEKAADTPFSALSGGQQQRALLARALCCQPEILLLDEPMSNVDMAVEGELLELLSRIRQRMTVVLVSHDIAVVSRHVESVICVNKTVAVHPTSVLDGTLISKMYGEDINLIRHDHRCSEEGHTHACNLQD